MNPATRAIATLLELLQDAEIRATRDSGSFRADPIGVLVALPSLVSATLGARTFEVPIIVVSGDPLNTIEAVDRIYAEADAIADVVRTLAYRPTTWAGRRDAEPLPAIELTVTVTVTNEEE